ncbi:MAG: polysaccharide biosynthesis protein [Phycisphaerales bacterium]|nr:polysaccharide biosynthesis protein [Phycisphaerales bacterium]
MNDAPSMSEFEDRDVLVTGGCGSIGSEIVRQLDQARVRRVRVLDNNESGHWRLSQSLASPRLRGLVGDVRDLDRVRRAMEGVDVVFHAAALKHVPLCEYNPFEAVQTNVVGTQNVVRAANECGVDRFIGISTDKAVHPVSTMGATKLLSERLIVNAPLGEGKTKYCCVRFGNVLGSAGSVVPLFAEQIARGGPVTITSDQMTRYVMTIPQCVRLVLAAATLMKGHETFVLKMNRLRIVDLAEVMIRRLAPQYGHDADRIAVQIVGTRPGEKLHELLLTEEEAPFARELDNLIVIGNATTRLAPAPPIHAQAMLAAAAGRILGKGEIQTMLERDGHLPIGGPLRIVSSSPEPGRQRKVSG